MQGLFQSVVPVAHGRRRLSAPVSAGSGNTSAGFARDDEMDAHQCASPKEGAKQATVRQAPRPGFHRPSATSLSNRSRGMKTNAETKRSNLSRRTNRRVRGRSSSRSIPCAMSRAFRRRFGTARRGENFEDANQRLAAMARWREAAGRDDAAPACLREQRDVVGVLGVGRRGEQPDDAEFARSSPSLLKSLTPI